jgi:hypothetical protein
MIDHDYHAHSDERSKALWDAIKPPSYVLMAERCANGWFARIRRVTSPEMITPQTKAIHALAPTRDAAIGEVTRQLRATGYEGEIVS